MDLLAKFLGLLADHLDLVQLVFDAIEGGVSKDSLIKAIRAEMVNASDAEMHRELGQ